MMEALLFNYTSRLSEFMEWAMTKVSSYLEIENVKVDLIPFKLTDDDNLKALLGGLAQAGKSSFTTLFEEYGMDYAKEQNKVIEEQVMLAKNQINLAYEVEQAQFMAGKKRSTDMNDNEEYKMALQKAQGIAEQLATTDPGTQFNMMNQLKLQDYGQYLLVSKLLEDYTSATQPQPQPGGEQDGPGALTGDPTKPGSSGEPESQPPKEESEADAKQKPFTKPSDGDKK
jgi:hypothetical protein